MSDTPSTVDPTGTTTVVNPTPAVPPVSTAQTPAPLTSAERDAYEGRIRSLMSDKDKALNESRQAIAEQVKLQQQYTDLQNQIASNMTAAAQTTQDALNQLNTLKVENQKLQAAVLKFQHLAQKPELLPYSAIIPDSNDPDTVAQNIAQFEQIRQQDLQRYSAALSPSLPSTPATPASIPTPAQTPNIWGLYQQRTGLPPGTIPASAPAAMNPQGAGNIVDAINDRLTKARASGNVAKFEAAVKEASLMAQTSINQQLGR